MIRILVNGNEYDRVKQLDVTNSLDDFSASARIIITDQQDGNSIIKLGNKITIYLDEIAVVCGYVEKLSDSESDGSHDINIELRSEVADIIDSTCPDNLKFIEGVSTYKDLVQKAVDGLGLDIEVIDNVNVSFSGEIKAAAVGQNCLEFLQEYARKAQVFLNTDGLGNIFIRRPGGDLTTWLVEGQNILSSSISLDLSKRYNRYVVYANSNVTAEGNTDNLNAKGEATDGAIRSTRLFEKIAEKPMSANECANAAAEEANIRRIRSFDYTCTVAGFSGNGELWAEGKLVNVSDTRKGVVGKFVIRSVSYQFSESGEFTTLNLAEKDAYTLAPEPSASDAQQMELASPYQE